MTTDTFRRRFQVPAQLAALLCCALGGATAAAAQSLALPPGAVQTATRDAPKGSESVALGPWVDGAAQVTSAEGAIAKTAWRIDGTSATTLELLEPMRADLTSQGFSVIFECETDRCGGFDFRYGLNVLPEPDMHVDLGDFRYLAAQRKVAGGTEYATLLVSRSSRSGYVQLTGIDPSRPPRAEAALSTKSPDPSIPGLDLPPVPDATVTASAVPAADDPKAPVPPPDQLAARIEAEGKVALDDLVFASGSADLGQGDFPSLASVAAYLAANPGRRITLVGHTDAVGDLGANIALSKKRAQSVMARLIDRYGVPPAQIDAQGAGFLSPRASNLTDQGRTRNRRVEAMLASTR